MTKQDYLLIARVLRKARLENSSGEDIDRLASRFAVALDRVGNTDHHSEAFDRLKFLRDTSPIFSVLS